MSSGAPFHGGEQGCAAEAPQDRAQGQEARVGQAAHKRFSLECRSGVQGICWQRFKFCWRLYVQKLGKQRTINFPISKFLQQGLGEEQAVAAALCEAKAYREELVRKGSLKPRIAEKRSTVRGVFYDKNRQKWRVRFGHPATKNCLHCGYFAAQEEAEAKARELATELGIKEVEGNVVPVKKLCELKRFTPLGPEVGVTWVLREQCWLAQCKVAGKRRSMRSRPKDFSEKEVEKAWKHAVAWRNKQEKEQDQATAKTP